MYILLLLVKHMSICYLILELIKINRWESDPIFSPINFLCVYIMRIIRHFCSVPFSPLKCPKHWSVFKELNKMPSSTTEVFQLLTTCLVILFSLKTLIEVTSTCDILSLLFVIFFLLCCLNFLFKLVILQALAYLPLSNVYGQSVD